MGRYPYNLKRRILGITVTFPTFPQAHACAVSWGKKKTPPGPSGASFPRKQRPVSRHADYYQYVAGTGHLPGDELSLEVMLRDSCSCVYEV